MTQKIIALLGTAGSGKDTAAKYIREFISPAITLALADPLKEFGKQVFDFLDSNLYGSSSLRNHKFSEWSQPERWTIAARAMFRYAPEWSRRVLLAFDEAPEHLRLLDAVGKWFYDLRAETLDSGGLSARRMLQTLGTECGRRVTPDIWANYGLHRAEGFLRNDTRAVIITDCRFVNEARLTRERGGEVWFMDRPVAGLEGDAGRHASELEIRTPEMQQYVTRTFRNGGTLEELRAMVSEAVTRVYRL